MAYRIYKITDTELNQEVLVEAVSRQQAVMEIVGDRYTVKAMPNGLEVGKLMAAGTRFIQAAGAAEQEESDAE